MNQTMKTWTIQEISRRTGLTAHTLRFWESELKGILLPLRTKGQQRRYALEHLLVIEEIKALKARGLTLNDIRDEMNGRHGREGSHSADSRIDLLAYRISEAVKAAICIFLKYESKERQEGEPVSRIG
jgi:DNA-binding transcriptional MerR regulator